MKKWKSIKEELYYEDGSLRDLYVFGTNKEDWKNWSSMVNKRFEVEFYNGQTQKLESRIDIETVFSFWKNSEVFADSNYATIKLGKVIIKCYFFIESEIENDIDPREVKEEEDQKAILEYLLSIKQVLKKKVVMTPELEEETILLQI
jgi:hypothetical protein